MAVWRSVTQLVTSDEQFSLVHIKNPTWHCPWILFVLRINQERNWSQAKDPDSPIPTSRLWEAGAHAELTFPSKDDPGGPVTDTRDLKTELLHHWETTEAELRWAGTMALSYPSRMMVEQRHSERKFSCLMLKMHPKILQNFTWGAVKYCQCKSLWSYCPKRAVQKPKTAFASSQSFFGAVWAHGGR